MGRAAQQASQRQHTLVGSDLGELLDFIQPLLQGRAGLGWRWRLWGTALGQLLTQGRVLCVRCQQALLAIS